MKILYGITKSNFGGAQRYVFELAVEAKENGHDVMVVSGENGILVEKLLTQNIKVISLQNLSRDISLFKEIKSFKEILEILKRERPDVFHINSSKMGGLGGLAARVIGIKKIIFTSHGWAFNEPRPWWQKQIIKSIVWVTVMLSHHTIVVSEKTKRDIEKLPFIQEKLTVITNGLSPFTLLSPEEARQKLVSHHTKVLVGTLSELHNVKGLDILLIAWSKFIKKHEATLVIIGTGEERNNLETLAKNLGISQSVIFKGFIDNARSLLSGLDIFCMPSRSEAMPYAPLEAGFAQLPVIATKVGGIPEIIENGTTGILVPREDSEIIFSSLILLAEDEELRKRLGINLKANILENFSFEKMVESTFDVYR